MGEISEFGMGQEKVLPTLEHTWLTIQTNWLVALQEENVNCMKIRERFNYVGQSGMSEIHFLAWKYSHCSVALEFPFNSTQILTHQSSPSAGGYHNSVLTLGLQWIFLVRDGQLCTLMLDFSWQNLIEMSCVQYIYITILLLHFIIVLLLYIILFSSSTHNIT